MSRYSPFETGLGDLDTFADGAPYELFARMRDEAPVMWTDAPADWPQEDQPGFWSLTRAEHIAQVSRDPQTFSSWLGGFSMRKDEVGSLDVARSTMIGKDGDEHTRQRTTVNKAFTPWRVRELGTSVHDQVAALFDAVLDDGECDLVRDLAGPLSNGTIADLLGVPEADRGQLDRWTDAFLNGNDAVAGGMRGDEALAASAEYLMGLLLERRACPGEDLITALDQVTYRGEPMPPEEQVGVFAQLFAAGIDSTKSTIANGVLALIEHPDQQALLREDPSLIPGAIEEILRWKPPFTHQRRTATRDTELGGQTIHEGDSVVMWLQSSNRDPRAIDRPDVFDVTRQRCPHHTFGGGGRHFCLGAGLARLELTAFFTELLACTTDLQLTGPPQRIRSTFVDGFTAMPIAFARTRRRDLVA